MSEEPLDDVIQALAWEYSLKPKYRDASALDNWLRAERQIKSVVSSDAVLAFATGLKHPGEFASRALSIFTLLTTFFTVFGGWCLYSYFQEVNLIFPSDTSIGVLSLSVGAAFSMFSLVLLSMVLMPFPLLRWGGELRKSYPTLFYRRPLGDHLKSYTWQYFRLFLPSLVAVAALSLLLEFNAPWEFPVSILVGLLIFVVKWLCNRTGHEPTVLLQSVPINVYAYFWFVLVAFLIVAFFANSFDSVSVRRQWILFFLLAVVIIGVHWLLNAFLVDFRLASFCVLVAFVSIILLAGPAAIGQGMLRFLHSGGGIKVSVRFKSYPAIPNRKCLLLGTTSQVVIGNPTSSGECPAVGVGSSLRLKEEKALFSVVESYARSDVLQISANPVQNRKRERDK